jgi:hypothetical protein
MDIKFVKLWTRKYVTFEVLSTVTMIIAVFSDVMSFSLVNIYRRFGLSPNMKSEHSSETSVNITRLHDVISKKTLILGM